MKTSKHLKETCNVHSLTFGGHCLNCGINAPEKIKETKEERIEYLRRLGFEFPQK